MDVIEHACDKCGGDGRFRDPRIWGTMPGSARCDSCDGTGKIEVVPASQLRGAVKALEHIAVHGNHDQECQRPPQDCAADALARFTTLGGQ